MFEAVNSANTEHELLLDMIQLRVHRRVRYDVGDFFSRLQPARVPTEFQHQFERDLQ